MKFSLFIGLCMTMLVYSTHCHAQSLYVAAINASNNFVFGQIDPATCVFCAEMSVPATTIPTGMVSLNALPNGQVAVIDGGGAVLLFDPPNPVPLATIEAPPNVIFGGGELAPNGLVYIPATIILPGGALNICIYQFNPSGNALTQVGCFPPDTWSLGDLYFWNGELYAFAFDIANSNTPNLITVGLGPVLTATIVQPVSFCGGNTTSIPSGPNAGIYGTSLSSCSGVDFVESDPNGNVIGPGCTISSLGIFGLSAVPTGFPPNNCTTCTTEAGSITTNASSLCINTPLQVTQTGSVLDANDITQYIISTSPTNPSGTIVLASNTPNIAFASPLMPNVTYYVSAFTGNNVSNAVDFDDPCLDSSNVVSVIWRPLPSVAFTLVGGGSPNLCAGQCRSVGVNFTGTAPFTLTYSTPFGGSTTQTFNLGIGAFQVCAPANAALGPLIVQATKLVDNWCTCE
jgi:hypothetical protein